MWIPEISLFAFDDFEQLNENDSFFKLTLELIENQSIFVETRLTVKFHLNHCNLEF